MFFKKEKTDKAEELYSTCPACGFMHKRYMTTCEHCGYNPFTNMAAGEGQRGNEEYIPLIKASTGTDAFSLIRAYQARKWHRRRELFKRVVRIILQLPAHPQAA